MTDQWRVLVIDDNSVFIDTVRDVAAQNSIQHVSYATSANDAAKLMDASAYSRIIADLRLEENIDGVTLLEKARRRWPNAECVLLTGYPEELDFERLRGLGVSVVSKRMLNTAILCNLLRSKEAITDLLDKGREVPDVGVLNLRYEEMIELNQLFICDLLDSLGAITNQGRQDFVAGSRMYSVADIVREIESRSRIGLMLIRTYLALQKHIRGAMS